MLPFLFRGALDVSATEINDEMKLACLKAIADLAFKETSDVVANAYRGEELKFGPEYIIPKPFDPRLILEIAPAVAQAAMDTGVAKRPLKDMEAYKEKISSFIFKSSMLLSPILEKTKKDIKTVIYAEGENTNVLTAVQAVVDEKMIKPILIGRPDVIEAQIQKLGIRLKENVDFTIINPANDKRYKKYWTLYHSLTARKGVSKEAARTIVRTNTTVIAALAVKCGDADAMLCGSYGRFDFHVKYIIDVIGKKDKCRRISTLSTMILPRQTIFLSDAFMDIDPSAEQIVESTLAAAERIKDFGIEPKVALLSHSNFGTSHAPSALKMKKATEMLKKADPELQVEGEMHADAALIETVRSNMISDSKLKGAANLMVFPNLDAANIALGLIKSIDNGLMIGPILLNAALPVHIVTPSTSARGIFNMSAIVAYDAQK